MHKSPLIWLTRPAADSESLAAELTTHDIASIIAPVMNISSQAVSVPTDTMPNALLLTSRHAAHALASLPVAWRTLPIYCIGNATASAASTAGFTQVIASDGDVLNLLPRIAQDVPAGGRVLYFSGEDVRVDAVALLATHTITVERHVAYTAVASDALSDEICAKLREGEITAVAFFSPRSARIACELLMKHSLQSTTRGIHAYCLSLPVAEAAGQLPWVGLSTCHIPTRAAMVDLMVSVQKKT